MNWNLIESDQDLGRILEAATGSEVVVLDTEFMRRNTFFPQVALLQLCFIGSEAAGTAWLIDPLKIEDTSAIAALLVDPAVIKVLHSASEDLEVFQAWLGVLPQPMFDSQRAAALAGLGFGLGYRALVQQICDVDLPKGETRSDWLQRPLTQSQCEYAAQDVTWLVDVYREVALRCREQDKFDWVLQDGLDAVRSLASNNVEYYKRIKNAWKLTPEQLARLIAVCEWREQTARTKNKPRSWIIDDRTCLQVAQNPPADRAQLQEQTEIAAPSMRRYGKELLRLLEEIQQHPADPLPDRLPAPLDARQREQVKRLKNTAREIAAELGVAPEILLQSKDYEALLRDSQATAAAEPGHWQGWRQERIIQPLREQLAGEQS